MSIQDFPQPSVAEEYCIPQPNGHTRPVPILREGARKRASRVPGSRATRRVLCAVVGASLATLLAVSGVHAQAQTSRSKTAARNTVDAFKTTRKSPTSFTWTYTNKRPVGSPPVNGETIQITSGSPAILQSVSFDGIVGKPTGAQSAFSFYPLDIAAGTTVTGTGTTNAPLPSGTTFKFFVTTDGFATTANTDSVDSTLGSATTLAGKPKLELAEQSLEKAIAYEDKAVHVESAMDIYAAGGRNDLKDAKFELKQATTLGEIDQTTNDRITSHIDPAISDDDKAIRAGNRHDTTSGKHWLAKARVEKEDALRLIKAALKS